MSPVRETDTYCSYTIRTGVDGRPVAVLLAADGLLGQDTCFVEDWSPTPREEVFDLPSLEMRVANLRRSGLDAGVSEAALAEIRTAALLSGLSARRRSSALGGKGISTVEFAFVALAVVVMAATMITLAAPLYMQAFRRAAGTVLVEQSRVSGAR